MRTPVTLAAVAIIALGLSPGTTAEVNGAGEIAVTYTRSVDTNQDGIFTSDEESQADVFVDDLDPATPPVMAHPANRAIDITPNFSSDGNFLAWSSGDTGDGSLDIKVKNLTTGEIVNITNTKGVNERWPAWSPDGSLIAYNRKAGRDNLDIWVMNADGSNQRYLAGKTGPGTYLEDCCVSFTPDGTSVVWASNRNGNFDLYRYPISMSGPENPYALRQLTSHRAYEGTPAVEPSGSIVFRYGGGVQQIQRIGAFGGPAKTVWAGGQIRTPQASPDGQRLAFGWRPGPGAQLDIAASASNGTGRTLITRTPALSETDPDWR